MTITWPPVARWAQGINADEQALSWVPQTQVIDKIGYALPPGGHPELASGILLALSPEQQEQGRRLPLHPVAALQAGEPEERDAAARSARPVPHLALREPGVPDALADREGLPRDPHKRRRDTAMPTLAILETYKYWDTMGRAVVAAIGGKDPQAGARRARGRMGRADRADRRRPPEGGLCSPGRRRRRLPSSSDRSGLDACRERRRCSAARVDAA